MPRKRFPEGFWTLAWRTPKWKLFMILLRGIGHFFVQVWRTLFVFFKDEVFSFSLYNRPKMKKLPWRRKQDVSATGADREERADEIRVVSKSNF